MKLLCRLVSVSLVLFATLVFAQSETQKTFDSLKKLAGSWETTAGGKTVRVALRVTSLGNAILHEMRVEGSPEDPITMIHLDKERLFLTHYCDAGNQPRMTGTISPDGKTIVFTFLDATNLLTSQVGHMQQVTFHLIDTDHHSEKWDFLMADGKQIGDLMEFRRSN